MALSRRSILVSFLLVVLLAAVSLFILNGIGTSSLSHSGEDSEKIVELLRLEAQDAQRRSNNALSSPVWKNALAEKRQGLTAIREELGGLLAGLPAISEPLREEMPFMQESLRRLTALADANAENPVMLRVIFLRNLLISSSLRQQILPLQTAANIVEGTQKTLAISDRGFRRFPNRLKKRPCATRGCS